MSIKHNPQYGMAVNEKILEFNTSLALSKSLKKTRDDTMYWIYALSRHLTYIATSTLCLASVTEYWTFRLPNLFARTVAHFVSNLRTFELTNVRT